ncbi:hypothetical protein BJV78DRAFT_1284727 [Lactifluus subvellereus]|nr:hypothetical protein BJV78DRAFT_1284727 [Lactifluus subvellereus]
MPVGALPTLSRPHLLRAQMPLTRPKHKNSSRSPGISSASYFQSSSTPKGFHPPSYYAAAAGLTYPDDDKSSETPTRRTATTNKSLTDFDDSFVPAPMPTAQLPVSSSASSTEPSLVSRMSFLNRRLSRGNGMSSKSPKRKSQLADLPLVEAQLVPSLRDTIDRMTNSPNSQTHSPAIVSHPSSQQNSHGALSSPSPHPPPPSTPPARQRRQTGPFEAAHSPATSTTRSSNVLESSRIPTPVSVAKTKLSLKPALKNAVASSSISNPGQGSQSSPTKASPSRSLRSVKAMIGRKTPQIPAEPAPSDITYVQAGNMSSSVIGSNRLARERSRTDPGHVSKIPSRSPHVPATPRVPPPVSTFSTPGRAPHGTPLNRRYAALSDSSGSELNLQGERGRALFVTNALIVPSSSSSSEEVEASQPVSNTDPPTASLHTAQRNYPYDRRPPQLGVGLGLTRMSNIHAHSRSHAAPLAASDRPGTNIENEHNYGLDDEDADPLAVSSSSSSAYLRSLTPNRRTLRSPNLTRNIGTTSGGILPNPWGSSDVKLNESDQRRRELIELVNEMDHGSLGSAQPYDYDSLSDDEYAGEQGLAISPSDNFDNNTNTPLRTGGGDDLRRQSLVSGTGQATPRQSSTRIALAGEHTEYSPLTNLPGALGRVNNQTVVAHRKVQEPEFSPLSEYSDDDEAQYGTNNTGVSLPPQRNYRGPLTRDLFRSKHEGDYPLSSRESSNRAPIVSPALPISTRHRSSGTEGCSEKARRTSHESPVASSPKVNFHGTHSSAGTRSLSRVRERNGTQRSPARASDTPLPHADSASSMSSPRWRNEDQGISVNAEVVFEQLSTGRQSAAIGNSPARSQWQGKGRKLSTVYPIKSPSPRETPNSHSQPVADPLESHNIQRAYEGMGPVPLAQRDQRNSQASGSEQRTWLSTVSSSVYHSLRDRYGEVEMERQQIIWDLCETERTFVRRLRTFVRLFICPLRMKDSVTWLAGVPPEAARLFDWLEDIINIHAQLSSALRAIVSEQYPIVQRIAGKVRSFVSHLEVHQPYVVRLESTTLLIKRLTEESSSDFGEFIRIQQEQDECHGWSVEAFLVEPVNRLVDYPIHFKRLLDVTPRGHPDHLATFSLLHYTEAVIRVMREVKLQEEEYELVKDRLGHIKDLPASSQLAHRSRRLLARGRLEREHPRDRTRTTPSSRGLYWHEGPNPAAGVRQSRLISAIQSRAMRSDSIKTTSESTSSMESHFSDGLPTTPHLPGFIQRSTSASSLARQNVWDNQFVVHRNEHPNPGSRGRPIQILYTLVFNDIVILASPTDDTSGHHRPLTQVDSWCLLEGIGISRVFKVVEDANQIVLDLLPVDPVNVTSGAIPDNGQLITLTLSIPPTSSSGVQLDMSSMSRLRQNWMSAFQECAEHTFRALSFPTQSGKLVATLPGLRCDNNSQTSDYAILGSGLPLPKSPSTQMAEPGADPAQQEREARGWWALRFQQVLHEMQRGSTAALITISPSTYTSGGDTSGKLPTSQPRILKLSSLSSFESIANRLA